MAIINTAQPEAYPLAVQGDSLAGTLKGANLVT